jgi:hypothetical protein
MGWIKGKSMIWIDRISTPFLVAQLCLLWSVAAFAHTPKIFPDGDVSNVEATVKHSDHGCWVLDTKYGWLETTNLDPKFEIENLKVLATVHRRKDVASGCMVGRAMVTITSIKRIGADTK